MRPSLFEEADRYIDSIPYRWSLSVGIDTHDWITITFYRWYFNKKEGLPMSFSIDWSIRRFWRLNIEP